jgi:hypothetical protein
MGPIVRIDVPDGRTAEITSLKDFALVISARYFFAGITPENIPLAHAEIDSGKLSIMDLNSQST